LNRLLAGWLERNRGYILVLLINLLVTAGAIIWLRWPEPAPIRIIPPAPTSTPSPTATPQPLRVYISGAVVHPDVYRLPPDSIVKDAIDAAGGPAPGADLDRVNQAQPLHDGEQVYVPRAGEASPPVAQPSSPTPGASPARAGRVNINTATAQELETLPGIGPALAQRIVDYRAAHGPFQTIEQIKDVPGIGDAIFEKIKDLIEV
jgi:competence protein ComEA